MRNVKPMLSCLGCYFSFLFFFIFIDNGIYMTEQFVQTVSSVNYNKGIFSLYFVGQDPLKMAQGVMAESDNELALKQTVHMPAAGFMYKAVNTMDSMVGYKNDKYLYFGRCAAKLDDVVNYIPARISAWLMILASACERMNWKNAEKIYKRDRYCHASPNSAQTEAVMAGALEVQLAGDAVYFGKVVKKPTIGDDIRPVEAEDIKRANHLMYLTSFLGLVFFAGIRALFLFL